MSFDIFDYEFDYNGNVKKLRNSLFLLVFTLLMSLGMIQTPIDGADPTGYDVVAAVNAYRAANGYYAMTPNSYVMAAAQAHAEWIVETGQGGHIGASGSDETVRVSWTGYGGGAAIQCDENWASGPSIASAMSGAWSDWVHQEVMLNQWGNKYTDAGGGVAAKGNGNYVFILNVCKVIGQEASGDVPEVDPNTGEITYPTPDYSNYIYGVTTATPQADGKVVHKVLYGQTLATIAEAYGVTIEQLQQLNGMAAGYTVIWVDEELTIKEGGGQPIAQPTATASTPTAAPTLAATRTPLPTAGVKEAASTQTPEKEDREKAPPAFTAGMVLLGLAGTGLVIILITTMRRH